MCADCGWTTASGKYYPTNAEKAYAFVTGNLEFEEAHTALDDAIIETLLFALVWKRTKGKFEMGIEHFPFRIVGRTYNEL